MDDLSPAQPWGDGQEADAGEAWRDELAGLLGVAEGRNLTDEEWRRILSILPDSEFITVGGLFPAALFVLSEVRPVSRSPASPE